MEVEVLEVVVCDNRGSRGCQLQKRYRNELEIGDVKLKEVTREKGKVQKKTP